MPREAVRFARLFFALALLSSPIASASPDGVLAIHDPSRGDDTSVGISGRLHAFIADDPLPVSEYMKNWQGSDYRPRSGDNLGVRSVRAELAARAQGWELARLYRGETFIRMNRDTTDVMRLYKTRSPAAAGSAFEIDADYRAVDMSGWRIARAWRWPAGEGASMAAGIAWSDLAARRTRDGQARGSFEALAGGKYGFDLVYDDVFDRKTYPFLTPGTPSAHGSAWDLALAWETEAGARAALIANDLFGRLQWHDLPGTQASVANGNVVTVDASGYINYLPALSGRNARRDFLQRLPSRWALAGELPWHDCSLYGSLAHQQGEYFPLVGAAWKYSANGRLQADYDLRFGSVGIGWAWRQLQVSLRSSARHLDDAHAYGLSVSLAWQI